VICFFYAVTLATLIWSPSLWFGILYLQVGHNNVVSWPLKNKCIFLLNFSFPTHILLRVLLVSDAHNFSAFMPSGELLLEIWLTCSCAIRGKNSRMWFLWIESSDGLCSLHERKHSSWTCISFERRLLSLIQACKFRNHFKKQAHWDVLPPSVLQHVNKYIIQSLLNMFPKCCRSMDVFNARQGTIIWVHLLDTYLSISWNVRNYLYARQWYFNIVKFNLLFDFAVTCTMLEKITWKGELTFDAILGSRKTFSSHSVFLALLPFLMLWPSALLWIARLKCLICEQCFKLC
jgi:hypothetical protein